MIIRHDPWVIFNELNSILERNKPSFPDDSKVEGYNWVPAVDIKEENGHFIFYVDIPGTDSNNIEIYMENNTLIIKGEREKLTKEEENNYCRIERVKGSFNRRFTLPNTADADQISAETKNGVLKIKIGKKKQSQVRKIEVRNIE